MEEIKAFFKFLVASRIKPGVLSVEFFSWLLMKKV